MKTGSFSRRSITVCRRRGRILSTGRFQPYGWIDRNVIDRSVIGRNVDPASGAGSHSRLQRNLHHLMEALAHKLRIQMLAGKYMI